MTDVQVKRKVGVSPHARLTAAYPSRPSSPTKSSLPSSPSKRAHIPSTASPSDALRPRAKVCTSANVTVGIKPPSTLSPGYASGSTTPRAPSPAKQPNVSQGRKSPNLGARTLSRVRSRAVLSAASAPSSPRVASVKSQYDSLSAATSDPVLSKSSPPRVRRPSISSISQLSSHSAIPNGVCSPPLSVISFSQDSDAQSNVSTQRIKAKVTNLAKGKPPAHVQSSPSSLLMPSPVFDRTTSQGPLSPGLGSQSRRLGRTASISSLSAPPTPAQIYPITTASPAANVHRYATLRSPSYTHRPSPSFTSPLQTEHKPTHSDSSHAAPPLSPPISSISFSSQSSVSRPSVAVANHTSSPSIHANGHGHSRGSMDFHIMNGLNACTKSRSNSLVIHDIGSHHLPRADSSEPDIDEISEEQTLKAEAKSHRKIADLEITTKSLLAINSQLEANKHKQAKEIWDLRRKLRESQLALPPRTYRELKASGDVVEPDKDDEEPEEQEVNGDEDARLTAEAIRLGKDDEIFDRVRLILENLLTTGKQALALKVEDVAPPKGGAKVLHEEEARTWRDSASGGGLGTMTPAGEDVADDATALDGSSSNSDYCDDSSSRRISDKSLDCNDSTRSEREVEELVGCMRSSTTLRA